MRILVIGAGAIGCATTARLSAAGNDVTLVVRNAARAEALNSNGIICHEATGETVHARPSIVLTIPAESFDTLILAVKAPALPDVARSLPESIQTETLVVPLVNGIPFWLGMDGSGPARVIRAVDPDGILVDRFAASQIAGSVVYTTAMMAGPAHVRVTSAQRIVLGPVAGEDEGRIARFAAAAQAAGIATRLSGSLRDEVWTKVALNLATNPLSVVSGAGLGTMCSDPLLEPLVSQVLDEVLRVAAQYGASAPVTRQQMLDKGRAAGAFRTSMLEDYLNDRPLELGAIADAVFALGEARGLDLPISRAIVALTRFRAKTTKVETVR
jgi:2-dehydropantoate 2-reductase